MVRWSIDFPECAHCLSFAECPAYAQLKQGAAPSSCFNTDSVGAKPWHPTHMDSPFQPSTPLEPVRFRPIEKNAHNLFCPNWVCAHDKLRPSSSDSLNCVGTHRVCRILGVLDDPAACAPGPICEGNALRRRPLTTPTRSPTCSRTSHTRSKP